MQRGGGVMDLRLGGRTDGAAVVVEQDHQFGGVGLGHTCDSVPAPARIGRGARWRIPGFCLGGVRVELGRMVTRPLRGDVVVCRGIR